MIPLRLIERIQNALPETGGSDEVPCNAAPR